MNPRLRACSREADRLRDERDQWIRLFNRLEAAVSHHAKAKGASGFSDEADDALAAAHRSVLSASATGPT